MAVVLSPITDSDLPRVAQFFERSMESRVEDWGAVLTAPWPDDWPNRGYMLLDGDRIVGAYVAYYSTQEVGGREQRVCNLGSWCVEPGHRMQSLRLLKALLGQEGLAFTDLTPSESVVRINRRLGFETLDTDAWVVPYAPLPLGGRRASVVEDPAHIRALLTGAELAAYEDHAAAPGALHAAIERDGHACWLVCRRDRMKGLPVLRVLHVGDRGLFRETAVGLSGRLLRRHRCVALVVEDRLAGFRPRLSLRLRSRQPRMFRGEQLSPEDVRYLYTELVRLPPE